MKGMWEQDKMKTVSVVRVVMTDGQLKVAELREYIKYHRELSVWNVDRLEHVGGIAQDLEPESDGC